MNSRILERSGSGPGAGTGEAGYNMVALVIIILLMNIAVATALPIWSTMIRREKEEELIFRGFQYAEAIRVFQQRHGRLPVKLEELVKVEPRSIRQLWTDPITDSDDWGLVLSAGANRTANQPGNRPGGNGRGNEKGNPGDPTDDVGIPGSSDPNLPKGPIVGVFSRSTEDSIKVFFDHQRYSDWKFTLPLITAAGGGPKSGAQAGGSSGHVGEVARGGGGSGAPRLGVKWLGRPFRPGVQPVDQPGAGMTGLPPSSMNTRPPAGTPGQDLVPAGKGKN